MAKSGGSVNTGAATRLVHTIGVIKWVVIALIAVGVLGVTSMSGFQQGFGGAMSAIVVVYGAVAALGAYVFMGWLQQTLHMLVGIAKNTARGDWLSRI